MRVIQAGQVDSERVLTSIELFLAKDGKWTEAKFYSDGDIVMTDTHFEKDDPNVAIFHHFKGKYPGMKINVSGYYEQDPFHFLFGIPTEFKILGAFMIVQAAMTYMISN